MPSPKLEDELGVSAVRTRGRRAVLNEAGRTLLDDGRHLLRAASDLERRVQRIADGWEAELRIALDAIIPSERLFPLLQAFYAAGHSTQIRIAGEVLGGTWDALATGRADLAIGAPGRQPGPQRYRQPALGVSSDFVFAVAPATRWPAGPGRSRAANCCATAPWSSPTPRRNSTPAPSG